mgnify:CR=1 FL=1
MKTATHTELEIANDPSLRWCNYRRWETVYSDVHQAEVRFVRYEGDGKIRLASLDGIAELPETVEPLQVRRASVMGAENKLVPVSVRGP